MSDYNSREQGRNELLAKFRATFGKLAGISVGYDSVYVYTEGDCFSVAHIWIGHDRLTISYCEAEDIEDADTVEKWGEAIALAQRAYKWLRKMQPEFYDMGD